jgi:NADH-quinone oxidoreductase subunit N
MLLAAPFLIAGLGFRMTLVPFHFYAPDVFQASPAFSAALLSFIPKVVGFVALWRLTELPEWLSGEPASLQAVTAALLAVFAGLTMFVGNLMALRQTDLHRLLAYSSVAHAGYMLVGVIAGRSSGPVTGGASLLFYLTVYGVMTIGAFATLLAASRTGDSLRTTQSLAGLGSTHPAAALLLTVFLFSLTGLPPTAGFLGKFYLLTAAWSQGSAASKCLAVLLGLNAAIAACYYLRLVAVMYLQAPQQLERANPGLAAAPLAGAPAWGAVVLCAIATLAVFLSPQWLWNASVRAAELSSSL